MIFYVVILAYVMAMALIGGAVLARYMLPAVPLVIIVCVSTLWRRLSYWRVGRGVCGRGVRCGVVLESFLRFRARGQSGLPRLCFAASKMASVIWRRAIPWREC